MPFLLCADTFFDVSTFLTRKNLAMLDECCRHYHRLVSNAEHCPPPLHFVKKHLVVDLPVSVCAAAQSSVSAAAEDHQVDNIVGGFFKLTQIVFNGPDEILITSLHVDDLVPEFIRCKFIEIKHLEDARILLFLKRNKHIFQHKDCSVEIETALKTPLSHWECLLFDLAHSSYEFYIKFTIPEGTQELLGKRRKGVGELEKRMRSPNGQITNEQHFVQEHHRLLDDFMNAVWPMNDCCLDEGKIMNRKQHFQSLGKAFAKWVHCGCAKENHKKVTVSDASHLIVPMVKEIMATSHQAILSDVKPSDRAFSFQFFIPYFKDLLVGASLPFKTTHKRRSVRSQARVDNVQIGESLWAYVCETTLDVHGDITIARGATESVIECQDSFRRNYVS